MYSTGSDWSLWRSFAAVVREGSLSAAARHLGLSQPTLGRHVENLERQLGVVLFERTLRGLKPTETALRLNEPVARANRALAEASLVAAGANPGLAGTIRLTTSTVTAHYILPAILAGLRPDFPAIEFEIVASDTAESLVMREADIAIRMFRPTQGELITRKLGESPMTCCAHQSYIETHDALETEAGLYQHTLVGFDRATMIIDGANALGFDLNRGSFALRTDSQSAMWEMLKAGLGVGFAQTGLVERTPGMVSLLPDLAVPPLEIWLTTHRELFTNRAIRAIYDRLGTAFTAWLNHETAPPSMG